MVPLPFFLLGGVAFLPLHWVVLLSLPKKSSATRKREVEKHHHPNKGRGGSTAPPRRRDRRTTQRRRMRKQHHPRGESNTTPKIDREISTIQSAIQKERGITTTSLFLTLLHCSTRHKNLDWNMILWATKLRVSLALASSNKLIKFAGGTWTMIARRGFKRTFVAPTLRRAVSHGKLSLFLSRKKNLQKRKKGLVDMVAANAKTMFCCVCEPMDCAVHGDDTHAVVAQLTRASEHGRHGGVVFSFGGLQAWPIVRPRPVVQQTTGPRQHRAEHDKSKDVGQGERDKRRRNHCQSQVSHHNASHHKTPAHALRQRQQRKHKTTNTLNNVRTHNCLETNSYTKKVLERRKLQLGDAAHVWRGTLRPCPPQFMLSRQFFVSMERFLVPSKAVALSRVQKQTQQTAIAAAQAAIPASDRGATQSKLEGGCRAPRERRALLTANGRFL